MLHYKARRALLGTELSTWFYMYRMKHTETQWRQCSCDSNHIEALMLTTSTRNPNIGLDGNSPSPLVSSSGTRRADAMLAGRLSEKAPGGHRGSAGTRLRHCWPSPDATSLRDAISKSCFTSVHSERKWSTAIKSTHWNRYLNQETESRTQKGWTTAAVVSVHGKSNLRRRRATAS